MSQFGRGTGPRSNLTGGNMSYPPGVAYTTGHTPAGPGVGSYPYSRAPVPVGQQEHTYENLPSVKYPPGWDPSR